MNDRSKPVSVRKWLTKDGLPAIVLLVADGSHHCGYVGVPKDHPLHGKGYDSPVPDELKSMLEHMQVGKRGAIDLVLYATSGEATVGLLFDVHGGITYANPNEDKAWPYPDTDTTDDLWWFGYDCAHYQDKTRYCDEGIWRDAEYCVNECESLASQLVAVAKLMQTPT